MQIILDISNNTIKSDMTYFRKMLDAIADVTPESCRHVIHIKTQLFLKEGDNIPMRPDFFYLMARVAYRDYGLMTTASVFDKQSVKTLLGLSVGYDLPFVKIANRPDLHWLAELIPRGIPVYKSVSPEEFWNDGLLHGSLLWNFKKVQQLLCVSKYPALIEEYDTGRSIVPAAYALSDHTVGLDLLNEHTPGIWEKHFVLPDSTGLDAGPWAITPNELGEVLRNADW
jgi:sialic acid synthase SpsE